MNAWHDVAGSPGEGNRNSAIVRAVRNRSTSVDSSDHAHNSAAEDNNCGVQVQSPRKPMTDHRTPTNSHCNAHLKSFTRRVPLAAGLPVAIASRGVPMSLRVLISGQLAGSLS